MSLNYSIKKIFCENDKLCIKFKEKTFPAKIKVRMNDVGNVPTFYKYFTNLVDCEICGDKCCISLSELFSKFEYKNQENAIELYAVSESLSSNCPIFSTINNEIIYDTDNFMVLASFNSKNNLKLLLKFKQIEIKCNEIFVTDTHAIMDFQNVTLDFELIIKKRFIVGSSASKTIARKNRGVNGTVEFPLELFQIYNLTYTCDFYANIVIPEINVCYCVPILYQQNCLSVNYKQMKIKFYQNMNNGLSVYVNAKIQNKQIIIYANNNNIQIECVKNIMLFNADSFEQQFEKQDIAKIKDNKIEGQYTLYEKDNDQIYKLATEEPVSFTINSEDRRFYIESNSSGVKIRIKKFVNPIKIATWASCYIRLAFRNDINLNWRDYFTIVAHYFQPSIFSITSSPITKIKQEKLYLEDNGLKVKREFEKTAIEELAESGAQYLLLDFYCDVLGGAFRFEDDTYIGSYLSIFDTATSHNIGVYQNALEDKAVPVASYYKEDYLDVWKEKCNKFCEMLTSIGYADKVILSTGYFNTKFLDSNKCSIINMNNKSANGKLIKECYLTEKKYIWDEMNKYFLKCLPNTKVIDLSSYKYFADYNNSLMGPHHFEKNYYRHLMAEVCKLILFDERE